MPAPAPVASLGELAQRMGLMDGPGLEKLVVELRDRLRAGRPTSLGRLLVERGVPANRVLAAAAAGEAFASVRCDACSATYPRTSTPAQREFPCQRCGALLVGFGRPFAATPGAAPGTDDGQTVRFQNVLSIPGAAPAEPAVPALAGGVLRFPEVPATPAASGAEDEPDGGRTIQFDRVLSVPARAQGVPTTPAAPMTPAGGHGNAPDEESGHTMEFQAVLPIPPPPVFGGAPPGFVPVGFDVGTQPNVRSVPPGAAPFPPPAPLADAIATVADPDGDAEAKTIAFVPNVAFAPPCAAPVAAPPPSFLPPGAPPPTGFGASPFAPPQTAAAQAAAAQAAAAQAAAANPFPNLAPPPPVDAATAETLPPPDSTKMPPGAAASEKKTVPPRKRYQPAESSGRSPLKIVLVIVFALAAIAIGIVLGTGLGGGVAAPPSPPGQKQPAPK